jgi:hypothetical protein
MSREEPNEAIRALRRPADEDERKLFSPRPTRRPPQGARCEKCGCTELSSLPTFSVGAGIAFRPIDDDVYCHRCGHIAPPEL